MATMNDFHPVNTRLKSLEGSMDFLPEQVVGIILSHVATARDVAMASATCRKWHEAAKHHLHKLAFVESDFSPISRDLVSTGMREMRITEAVFKTGCLQGLSICMNVSYEVQAAPVMAWLMYTKKTLRSLTFMNAIRPRVNILEKLGGVDSKLEHLEWKSAYIPTIDPTVHSFELLVSLTLEDVETLLASNLEALLSACPKLEFLYLNYAHISSSKGEGLETTMELKSATLKTLYIAGGLKDVRHLVLLMDRLEIVKFRRGWYQHIELVQGKGCSSLHRLSVKHVSISRFELKGSAVSLHEVKFCDYSEYFKTEWLKYSQAISMARNLQKLHLCSDLARSCKERESIDLHEISLSFPHLRFLALEYEHAFEAFETASFIMENVVTLELSSCSLHEQFARWIAEFMERCPKLERLRISGCVPRRHVGDGHPMNTFTACLIQIMRPYPHIDLKLDFS